MSLIISGNVRLWAFFHFVSVRYIQIFSLVICLYLEFKINLFLTLNAGNNFLYNCPNDVNSIIRTIEVPKGCGEVYKAAEGWSNHKFYIVEAT